MGNTSCTCLQNMFLQRGFTIWLIVGRLLPVKKQSSFKTAKKVQSWMEPCGCCDDQRQNLSFTYTVRRFSPVSCHASWCQLSCTAVDYRKFKQIFPTRTFAWSYLDAFHFQNCSFSPPP